MIHKHIKLIIGMLAICLISLMLVFIPTESRHQKHIMEAFLKNHYSAQKYDNYAILMSGDLEVTDLLYHQKYENLITKDAYDRMVAARVVLESEKTVKENGCTILMERSSFQKNKSATIEGNPSYEYIVQVKLKFGNNDISIVNLSGVITLAKQDGKWIISRFTPREFLTKVVEAK